jgi:hypothetical protein
MRVNLEANDYQFNSLVETIVTSPQFLTKRGTGSSSDYAEVADEE